MTSIDPGAEVISAAEAHLQLDDRKLAERIRYRCEAVEQHAPLHRERYDAVVVSEVLEHVVDKSTFLASCLDTLKVHISFFFFYRIINLFRFVAGWIDFYNNV